MLQVDRFGTRFGLTVMVGTLATVVSTFLPRGLSTSYIGLLIALSVGPAAFLVCIGSAIRRPWVLAAAFLPAIAALVYQFTYLIPPPPLFKPFLTGAAFAAVYAMLVHKCHSKFRLCGVLTIGCCVLWWVCWSVAIVAATPSVSVDTPDLKCAANLKAIGIAWAEFEKSRHRAPSSLSELVQAGMVHYSQTRCSLGFGYVKCSFVLKSKKSIDSCVLLCPNHPDKFLLLTRGGAVRVFVISNEVPPKFGPLPWWL